MIALRSWVRGLAGLLLLGGCASTSRPPVARPTANNPIHSIQEISAGGLDNQVVTVIAPVFQLGSTQTLVPAISVAAPEQPAPLLSTPGAGVLLEGPALKGLTSAGVGSYGIVRATGTVKVQAQGQRQLVVSETKIISPTGLAVRELLANSTIYAGQVVAVDGILIFKQGSALLAEAVGPGGIPTTDAQQLKITQPFSDPKLIDQLDGGPASAVRYGHVLAVGMWREQGLMIFWLRRQS